MDNVILHTHNPYVQHSVNKHDTLFVDSMVRPYTPLIWGPITLCNYSILATAHKYACTAAVCVGTDKNRSPEAKRSKHTGGSLPTMQTVPGDSLKEGGGTVLLDDKWPRLTKNTQPVWQWTSLLYITRVTYACHLKWRKNAFQQGLVNGRGSQYGQLKTQWPVHLSMELTDTWARWQLAHLMEDTVFVVTRYVFTTYALMDNLLPSTN